MDQKINPGTLLGRGWIGLNYARSGVFRWHDLIQKTGVMLASVRAAAGKRLWSYASPLQLQMNSLLQAIRI